MNRWLFVVVWYSFLSQFMEKAKIPKSTKVLLVTGHGNRHVVKEMFDLGISGYVMKPFDKHDLKRHLEYYAQQEPHA